MRKLPLIYQAAQNGMYGRHYEFASSNITDALFVFLNGIPSSESVHALERDYRARPLVCLTEAWELYINKVFPDAQVYTRYMMKPTNHFDFSKCVFLQNKFRVELFDKKAFDLHPFSHGENYSSYSAFQKYGAGAVVWHDDEIVSSASSFLTFKNEIELDVSTLEEYRGMGLATVCVRFMLEDCEKRGITVHWDAQNIISKHLAEKFGVETEESYSVYFLL